MNKVIEAIKDALLIIGSVTVVASALMLLGHTLDPMWDCKYVVGYFVIFSIVHYFIKK